MSEKLCNILVTWDAIKVFWTPLLQMNQWDTEFSWYSSSAVNRVCLYGLEHDLGIHDFKRTWPCLIVDVLATRAKSLLSSVYCTVTNCAFTFRSTNVFCYFRKIMTHTDLVKHYHHHHHHHHHVALVARISLTLSRHSSLSFITLGRSSGQHPVSSHSCWIYVRAGRPAFARPCVGVHKSISLMSSSLLLQQCPACLVRLTWIVFVIGGRWPYSWCLVGCCRQDLFKIARSILV